MKKASGGLEQSSAHNPPRFTARPCTSVDGSYSKGLFQRQLVLILIFDKNWCNEKIPPFRCVLRALQQGLFTLENI